MTRRFCGKVLIMLGVAVFLVARPAISASPSVPESVAVVEALHGELLEAMKTATATTTAQRAAKLGPVVDSSFDLNRMSKFAAGSGWRKMTDDQKADYLRVFTEITVATYADRFDGYSGESFATVGTEAGLNESLFVNTILQRPGKEPVKLTYVVLESGAGPKIVDIYLQGSISELARQRSEYQSVLRTSGADALISGLRDQTKRMLDKNG